jgi:hypothetical protein
MKSLAAGPAAVIGIVLSLSAPVMAHHSAAPFDQTRTVEVQGTVTEFQYTNPHSWLIIAVTKPDGTKEDWSFQAEGPSTLLRYGIKLSSLRTGEVITMKAYPLKDGRHAGIWVSLTKADGSVLAPRGPLPSD